VNPSTIPAVSGFPDTTAFGNRHASAHLTAQALGKALIMLAPRVWAESVVPQDKTKEMQRADRMAAIQHRLDIIMRDAREIRAELTKLSERDPFSVVRQRVEARAAVRVDPTIKSEKPPTTTDQVTASCYRRARGSPGPRSHKC
jgi:hypothetical protein